MCTISIHNRTINIPDSSISSSKQLRKGLKVLGVELVIKDKYALKAAAAYLKSEKVSFERTLNTLFISKGMLEKVFDGQKITFVIGDKIINYTVKQNILGRWFLKCEEDFKVNTYIFHLLHIKDINAFCLGNDHIVKGSNVIFPTHLSAEGLYRTIIELKKLC